MKTALQDDFLKFFSEFLYGVPIPILKHSIACMRRIKVKPKYIIYTIPTSIRRSCVLQTTIISTTTIIGN